MSMKDLSSARLYLVAPSRLQEGDLADLIPELAAAGVDMVQLREKEMGARDVLRVGEPVAAACEEAGIAFIVNDRPDIALVLDAGVHLGQSDIPMWVAARVLGKAIIGTSNQCVEDISRSLSEGPPDYLVVGPVYETPTKPGRPAVGTDLVSRAAARIPAEFPWFAIGGINEETIEPVLDAGATRVVVVRAITEAADPPGAAARLRELLAR